MFLEIWRTNLFRKCKWSLFLYRASVTEFSTTYRIVEGKNLRTCFCHFTGSSVSFIATERFYVAFEPRVRKLRIICCVFMPHSVEATCFFFGWEILSSLKLRPVARWANGTQIHSSVWSVDFCDPWGTRENTYDYSNTSRDCLLHGLGILRKLVGHQMDSLSHSAFMYH